MDRAGRGGTRQAVLVDVVAQRRPRRHAGRTPPRYTGTMMKQTFYVASAAFALTLLVQPVLAKASDIQTDGALPLYPRGRAVENIPPSAMRAGVPFNQTTNDSVQSVDLWFKSHLPKDCSRLATSGGVRWSCAAGYIVIQKRNGTFISYIPGSVQFNEPGH